MNWEYLVQYAGIFYKTIFLLALAIVMSIFLKMLKIFLSKIIGHSKVRYRVYELTGLTSGIIFIIIAALLFAHTIEKFAIPFSIIGAGIAFSLQEIIASIAGRMTIFSSNLYRIGDRIQIGEQRGDVIEIGFIRTSLMEIGNWVKADQYTGRVIHVANSLVLKNDIINYTANFPFVWDEIIIPVRYANDQHLAKKIIMKVSTETTSEYQLDAKNKWELIKKRYLIGEAEFAPKVTLIANDNWMEFTARYIVPTNQRRSVKDKLFTLLVDEFNNNHLEFASMTVEITSFPKLDVQSTK